jgi:transcriptional regulator with XRE-family HTH domain
VDAVEEARLRRQTRPERARAIRLAAGVSQESVARTLGVNRESIARWETGERRPRGELLSRYAALLAELERAAGGK